MNFVSMQAREWSNIHVSATTYFLTAANRSVGQATVQQRQIDRFSRFSSMLSFVPTHLEGYLSDALSPLSGI